MFIQAPELVDGEAVAGDAFMERMSRFHTDAPSGGGGKSQPDSEPAINSPLPVYYLTVNQALNESLGAELKPAEWQYPVRCNGRTRMVHVKDDGKGHAKFAALTEGALIENLEKAVGLARKELTDTEERYELRLLNVPAAQLAALWLHSKKRNLFVPIPSSSMLQYLRIIPSLREMIRRPAHPNTQQKTLPDDYGLKWSPFAGDEGDADLTEKSRG